MDRGSSRRHEATNYQVAFQMTSHAACMRARSAGALEGHPLVRFKIGGTLCSKEFPKCRPTTHSLWTICW